LKGEAYAHAAQLSFEYAPQPPFDAGTPETAGAEALASVESIYAPLIEFHRYAALNYCGNILSATSYRSTITNPHCRIMTVDAFYSYAETQQAIGKIHPPKQSSHRLKDSVVYDFIQDSERFEQAIVPFLSTKRLAIDCETTGIDPHTDRVRLVQIAALNHPPVVIDLFSIPVAECKPLQQLLSSSILKIAHNLKFDWQFLTQAGFQFSGPFFDTQLAYQVLKAGRKGKASLGVVTKKMLGIELDKSQQQNDFSQPDLSDEQLTYAATDAQVLLDLHEALTVRLKRQRLLPIAKLESACVPATAQMELNGMLLNHDRWQTAITQLNQQLQGALQTFRKCLGESVLEQTSFLPEMRSTGDSGTNPNSPEQVKQVFHRQGIVVKSTGQRALIALVDQHPAIPALLEYRRLAKVLSNFDASLIQHIHPVTGRIHPSYFQLGARSGRFSCRRPAIQTIPRMPLARRCFVAALGWRIVRADYSQIELRIVARISGDRRMIEAYQNNEDIHRLTASIITGNPIATVTEEERQIAKKLNFGLIYGMSAVRLQAETQLEYGIVMSLKEARTFVQRFFAVYKGVKRWHDRVKHNLYVKKSRQTQTLAGRLRRWGEDEQPRLTEMLNYPVQGTNADIIKLALGRLHPRLGNAKLIAVVHDEIVLECPEAEVDRMSRVLHRCMLQPAQKLLAPIPVVVNVQVLESWAA